MKKLILISADWCSACKAFKPTMEKVSKILPVEFYNSSVDHDMVLKYKINKIPTLILVENNVEIKRMTGNQSQEKVIQFFNE
jgi:thiol-disulfide isomerase/thioredoxin